VDASLAVFAALPSFFKKHGWANPTNAVDGPFQHVHGPVHGFDWLYKHPATMAAFFQYIYAQRNERPSFMDAGFYPLQDRLIDGASLDGSRSAFVDVGGGTGECLEEFRQKVPEWKGKLVLQDRESVVAQVTKLDRRIDVQGYDFFTPQPVEGLMSYQNV
jgi:hypothetical protein